MMENRFENPLEMAIRPSLLLKRYLQLLHALVALALFWPMEMSWMVRGVLLLLCLCSYFYYCRKCLLIPHVTALAWRRRGEWAVRDNAG